MRFRVIGLGRMGEALARQAMEKGHQVVGYDRDRQRVKALTSQGSEPAWSLDEGWNSSSGLALS